MLREPWPLGGGEGAGPQACTIYTYIYNYDVYILIICIYMHIYSVYRLCLYTVSTCHSIADVYIILWLTNNMLK